LVANYAFTGTTVRFVTTVPWSVTVAPQTGSFKPGKVLVRTQAFSRNIGVTKEEGKQS
jgi:hypothetical protein